MYKYNERISSPTTTSSSSSLHSFSSSTFHKRLRSTMCCFRNDTLEVVKDLDELEHYKATMSTATTARSACTWLKSTAHEVEIKYRCRGFISRLGDGGKGQGRKYQGSAEFRYDPTSYALNFEDERADEDFQISFSSRLPATPKRIPESKGIGKTTTTMAVNREIIQAF